MKIYILKFILVSIADVLPYVMIVSTFALMYIAYFSKKLFDNFSLEKSPNRCPHLSVVIINSVYNAEGFSFQYALVDVYGNLQNRSSTFTQFPSPVNGYDGKIEITATLIGGIGAMQTGFIQAPRALVSSSPDIFQGQSRIFKFKVVDQLCSNTTPETETEDPRHP